MRKSIIVAAAQNGVIGKDGKLPWHLPGDLRRFKELTMGHTLIMGRKTFESLPSKVRPLPGRTTIVLTRGPIQLVQLNNLDHAGSLDQAFAVAAQYESEQRLYNEDGLEEEIFVCGGGKVYEEALPLVDRVYLTVVERDFEGDTFFNFVTLTSNREIGTYAYPGDRAEWRLVAIELGSGDLPHVFEIWDRTR